MRDIYVCVIFLRVKIDWMFFYWSHFFDVHFSYCEVFMCQVFPDTKSILALEFAAIMLGTEAYTLQDVKNEISGK